MNEVLKVMFADDNREYCEIINDYFSIFSDIEIVSIARNGEEAYEMIVQNEPDIVVLDIIMPYIDGLGVIEKLKANAPRKMPLIIILSAIGQESITQNAISLGAAYYFVKPFNLDLLAERIRKLGNTLKKEPDNAAGPTFNSESGFIKKESKPSLNNIERHVTKIIRELGIPAHIKGYQFLRVAITMVVNDTELISCITKLLYPTIAKRYKTTPTRVESAIRHAVELAWERGGTETLNHIFGYTVTATMERPTNSEFIATVSDMLILEMKNAG